MYVTVTGTNDAPTLAAGAAVAVEDGPTVDVDLSLLGDDVDSDDDGASLTYSVSGDPSEGTAEIDGTTLTFTNIARRSIDWKNTFVRLLVLTQRLVASSLRMWCPNSFGEWDRAFPSLK